MRLLYCGDIVGKAGRAVVTQHLPRLIQTYGIDWVLVNAENAAAGFGLTPSICEDLFALGVDVVLTGNHVWDQKEIIPYIENQPRLIRPLNYPEGTPGRGVCVLQKPALKGRLVVIQIMGRLFMETLDDPFVVLQKALAPYDMNRADIGAVFVDIHAETTSEKIALAHMVDGRVSAVMGTHTHVPTADHRLLPKGSAFQSDVGMCGDFDSVIGMTKDTAVGRFLHILPKPRLSPAMGPATLCATLLDINEKTGLPSAIHPMRIGPHLENCLPSI